MGERAKKHELHFSHWLSLCMPLLNPSAALYLAAHALVLLLAVPGWGPGAIMRMSPFDQSYDRERTARYEGSGGWDLVACSYFPAVDYVAIEDASGGRVVRVVEIFEPERRGLSIETFVLSPSERGLTISWESPVSPKVFLSYSELELSGWFGPMVIYRGVPQSLWSWLGFLDSALFLIGAIVVAWVLRLKGRDYVVPLGPK